MKEGDKRTVRKDLEAGQHIDGVYVNDYMAKLAGTQVTIKEVFTLVCNIEEDSGFVWTDGMFEEEC